MARQRKNYEVRDTLGNIVPNPTVTVYISGGFVLASIYSDDIGLGTPLANPFTGGADGRFFFYASDGRYDVVVSSPLITTYTLGAENFVYQGVAVGTGITSLNTLTDAAQVMVPGTAGTDFAIVSAAGVHTFNIPTIGAPGVLRGLLGTTDYVSFQQKIISLNGQTVAYQNFLAGTTGTDVNWLSNLGNHTINIPTIGAAGVTRGLLTVADYNIFNAKQAALPGGGLVTQYLTGLVTWATLNTTAVPEAANLYYTDARARAAINAAAPIVFNAGTGQISIPAATGAVNGYLLAADWNTFFSKISSINASSVAAQTLVVGTAGTDFNIATVVGTGVTTFNLPSASAANRGLVTTGAQTFAGDKTFNGSLITAYGRVLHVRVATTTPVAVVPSDEVVVTVMAAPGPVAVGLAPPTVTGQYYIIKGGLGDEVANPVTITPAAGTIDGAPAYQINTAFGSVRLVYNGTQWNVI